MGRGGGWSSKNYYAARFFCTCFVRNDYFCEGSQVRVPGSDTDVILWDGKDYLSDSGCYTFNTPPLFIVQLLATTSDDLQVTICSGTTSVVGFSTENTPITLIEIYVK